MMQRLWPLAFVLLAACETPPLSLRFALTSGDSQQCISDTGNVTTSCAEVTMICDGVLSVRIVPPDAPEFPYVSVCERLGTGPRKLCSIAGIDLPQPTVPVPEQVLEVQMAVFSEQSLAKDGDGNYICPAVEFSANNLPVAVACSETATTSCPPRPAVGGRSYYYPGDEETVVELGCTDIELLRGETCTNTNSIDVFATVNDFDSGAGVTKSTADRLTVSIGEPSPTDLGTYALTQADATLLDRTGIAPPAWFGTLLDPADIPQTSYCLEVFEDVAQATRTLSCRQTMDDLQRIDIAGSLLSKATLDNILLALGKMSFPPEGLVVGIVLNQFNSPVAGARVDPQCGSGCTVKYWSADKSAFTTAGGTSLNGIWVSENAAYGSLFSWSGQVKPSFGGLVDGKVTIVVLQEATPIGGN